VLLDRVTPLILTYNEEANLGRVLDGLAWARRIVVLDSFSSDGTLEIARARPNVEVYQRAFDSFAGQCNYGLGLIETDWVLSLDADYVCPPALAEELRQLPENPPEHGYRAGFRYCVFGKPLRGTLYPPRTVLYRVASATYEQDGHAHRVRVDGSVGELRSVIDHDDRKPLSAWFAAQRRYAEQEADKLLSTPPEALGRADRLRLKGWIAPILAPLYALIARGGALDGKAGLYYALQRAFAEIALALCLLDRGLRAHDLRERQSTSAPAPPAPAADLVPDSL
jgi:glycosyltransferase involved in cell wall biosynthesis